MALSPVRTRNAIRNRGQSRTIQGLPVDSNCVMCLYMDEGSGDYAYDSSSYGNDGHLGAGVAANKPTWTEGRFGRGALDFNGTSDYVNCGNDASLAMGANNFTFETWVYPITYATVWRSYLGGTVGAASLGLGTANGYLLLTKVGIADAPTSSTQIPLNEWTHTAITFDSNSASNNLRYFVNGICVATVTFDIDFTAQTNHVGLRRSDKSHNYFNGSIDEVRIYSRALSEREIKMSYRGGRTPVR